MLDHRQKKFLRALCRLRDLENKGVQDMHLFEQILAFDEKYDLSPVFRYTRLGTREIATLHISHSDLEKVRNIPLNAIPGGAL